MRIVDATALAALLAIGGCSRSAPPYALPSDIDPVELKARLAAPQVVKTEQAVLSASPGQVGACLGVDRIQSLLAWQTKVASVKLEVSNDAGDARRLFATGPGLGNASTGDWVVEGTRFFLMDAATGDQLATLRISSFDCSR